MGVELSGTASDFSVSGGLGRITLPVAGAYVRANLAQLASNNSNVVVSTALGQPVVGGTAYVSVIARSVGSSDYQARVAVSTTNTVVLQLLAAGTTLAAVKTPLSYTTGQQLTVRVQASGVSPTTLRAKVWATGTAEPSAWTVTASDSTSALQTTGGVGLGAYLSSSSTGLPRVFTFDNLAVTAAN